ncbi:ParB-like nuclease domain-containing protein [Paraburkholderia sp. Ac-20342]|uniref:IbrB-like domain-containing protein n=1 Tax=Paraburkholderia sp. Ac-20342 TaxID=2703889 RepID=UPI0019814080|nr:ParB/RepB/Spo0J family partition protein [Paraburkholderia sp. Ac-20342]MBN3846961.1 ParB-like nuclease domain-containing protein [Paraburkholderia sp. Ac-20342]
MSSSLLQRAELLFQEIAALPLAEKVETLNSLRRNLHAYSPFASEPVDLVEWLPATLVVGNDYNPNAVAPPEVKLLQHSIEVDGFTQPIVTHQEGSKRVVVDGFHRQKVGKTSPPIKTRLHGYLPVVKIRSERVELADRMAATIRHNRARGIHGVQPMTEVVVTLLKAGWSDEMVAQRLGMDAEEVLRFKQVAGLSELFRNREYSQSWD